MNKIPIRNVVSVPIRSRHERTSFARWIATPCGSVPRGGRLTRIAPITRPVIRPESSRSRSAPTTIATTNINVPVTACDSLGLNHAAQARIRAAPATPKPTPTPTLRRNWKISCPAFACPATTALNTTTPSVAPMGSASVPSHFRTRLTVVGPLLSFIRPSKTVNSVLKWEGTFADPIGATLGVVVFNAVIAGHAKAGEEIFQFLLAVGIGAGFGILGGVLVLAWARWFKPSQSQAVTGTLMFVVAMVVCADLLRDDTGLITGLVIGAILVNRPPRGIEPAGLAIQTAKLTRAWRERIATLSTFLIGILFIILSARVSPHQIGEIGWVSLAFIGVLVLVGRPLAVGLSTLGSALPMRERAFIAWMAPRGIVAAATSSTFALGLTQAGVGGGAQNLIPITFIVIVATALIYGLSGGPVARALGVASTGPGGVLLIGATPGWARRRACPP